jgi:hypothetical protein
MTATIRAPNEGAAAVWGSGGSAYDKVSETIADVLDRVVARVAPEPGEKCLDVARDLLTSYPSEPMTMWPISARVNKPENDDPSLLDRTGDPFDLWAPLRPEGRA